MKEKKRDLKNALKIPLGMKRALFAVLIAFVTKMGINAEERFNERIVEVFSRMPGDREFHFAGVDQNGDGFADIFIVIPSINRVQLSARLAGFLREGATVSYDDANKFSDGTLNQTSLLEINGRSVLQIFPDKEADFPTEAARQRRLRAQAPASVPQQSVEDEMAALEAQLERLRQQRQQGGGR